MSRFAYALLGGIALVGAAAAPSFAQSAFNGPYVGVFSGYNFSDTETTTTGAAQDLNQDGWSYGGFVGYGQTFDRFYVGAEGEIGALDMKNGSKTLAGRVTSLDANESYGLSARAGYLINDNALVYGRVGWQRTNFEINSGDVSRHQDVDGVRFGGGLEVAMTDNVLARLEYNYTDYDALKYNIGASNYSVQPDGGELRLGVAYRF